MGAAEGRLSFLKKRPKNCRLSGVNRLSIFAECIERWTLVGDGQPIATSNSRLLPVRQASGEPAMLKLYAESERFAPAVLGWWNGDGAARLLAQHGAALLIERATGTASLAAMARGGQDDEACGVLCDVAVRLHAPRTTPPSLLPIAKRFDALHALGAAQGGLLQRCADAATRLLAAPVGLGVLHGDLHHDNVLDFGPRGWLAIDPKGLFGKRGFDFANIFTNPDLSDPTRPVASEPGRLGRRLGIVAKLARLEPQRLLRWVLAWAGLSASWILAGGEAPTVSLRLAELAAAELDSSWSKVFCFFFQKRSPFFLPYS